MRKLRIGYIPYSANLTHPADRRRLVYWARKRGHNLVFDINSKCDVIFQSIRADLGADKIANKKTPYVLDLVDGYLGQDHYWRDWLRGAGKVLTRQITGPIRPFSKVVESACTRASAVVCESIEQVKTIEPFCANVHPILDFHEEFPFIPFKRQQNDLRTKSLIWEGLPYTAKGLCLLSDFFSLNRENESVSLEMVTDLHYPLFLGKYFSRETSNSVKDIRNQLGGRLKITEWSIDSVVNGSLRSRLAILPLDPGGFLNPLKAENRLLIMWRLGLPTLTSPSRAYARVMNELQINGICSDQAQWTEKLNFLSESIDMQQNMVEAGQQYIRETHSEKLVLSAWDELFNSVL